MRSTTTSERRLLFAGGAVAAVAAVALGGWWASRPDLPADWAGRDRFCAEAQTFALTNQAGLTGEQRVAAMAALIRTAPRELTPDLERLAGSLADSAEPTGAHEHGTTAPGAAGAGPGGGPAAVEHDPAGHAHGPGPDEHSGAVDKGAPEPPEAVRASGRRAGEFIERTCGVNLPNVRT
ncbi:hypothetical protein [Micromonospora sp. NPDC092111]|uniref:hypothetical protein n=1 Tax=Micromonospora sp. NPDC092111 TaxID=3364289 RepID=UPI0038145A19